VVTLGLAAALPELSTVVDALRRRAPNVAVGTLVGSNVVNPLLAVGLGGVVSTYRVPAPVIWLDLPVKLVAGVGLLAVAFLAGARDGTLRRRDGAALVAAYFAFVAARLVLFGGQ
jgi:cation:H+ antiporter